MKLTIKKISIGLAIISGLLVFSMCPVALATNSDAVCNGVAIAGGGACTAQGQKDAAQTISNLVADIINILSWIIGVVSVIMIIVGGLNMITAAGDPGKITKARSTILYAVVGLVIVAVSQTLVHFVLANIK